MNTHIASGVLIAALSTNATAFGQVAPASEPLAQRFVDPTSGLSLEQAIGRALSQEPSLRAARSQVGMAEGLRLQASARPNPVISFERRDEPGGTDNQTAVGVEWPLDLFSRGRRVAVADREVAITRLAVADRERNLVADVRERYGEALAAVRDLGLLDELTAATARQYGLLRSRVQEGASPPLERDLLDVEVRRVESERLIQAGRAEAALHELKRILGLRADEPLTLREPLDAVVQRESSAEPPAAAAATAGRRADVREAAARIEAAEAKLERARRDGWFDVSVFASYMRMDAGFPQNALSDDGRITRIRGLFHYLSAGASVTIPMFNRNQGEVATARAERDWAEASRDAVRLAADAEIAAGRARDQRARQAVLLLGGSAQALARRNLATVSQSYELGRLTVFDVLAEQRRYLEVERAYTVALREAFEARTALNRALGELR